MSAGGAVIGALRVVLGADTADFDKGLKQSQSGLAAFGKQVAAIAGGISLEKGLDRAITALFGAVRSGIDEADKLNKLSQSIGIPVDELSKLKYAGDLADVSLESLGKSTVKLSKAMIEVAGGGTGPAKQAFDALGISVKNADGTMKSANDVLGEAADKFAGYKDGAAKTALAVALFGKAGAEMIPLLNMGKDGLKEAGDEAERFGLVLDKNTTQAAENYNDNLTKLHKTKDGIIIQITARLLPAMEDFSNKMVQAAKDGELLDKVASGIEYILRGTASVVLQVSVAFQRLFAEIGAFVTAYQGADGVFSGLKAGWAAMNAEGEKTRQVMAGLKSSVANIWAGTPDFNWDSQASAVARMNKEVVLLGSEWVKVAAPIIASDTASKNALQSFLDGQSKRTAAQNAEAQTVGKSVGEQAKLRLEYEAQALALAKGIPLTDAWRAKIAAAGDEAAAAAMKIQGANLVDQTASPWEQRTQKVQQYTASMLLAGASTEQLSIMNMQVQFPNFTAAANAAMDFGANLDRLATNSVSMLSSTLVDVISGTKSAGEAFAAFAKQVLQQVAQMIVQLLIMKALKMSMGMFFSEGGAVPFSNGGIAAFAPGGKVRGPGSGTSDSIPAYLSNGEFVVNAAATKEFMPLLNAINSGGMKSIPTPAESPTISGGSRGVLKVEGIEPGKLFTGETLRSLIEALHGAQRDGYQLSPA